MAVSLDDDVPLILTLDEGESAPLAPSDSLGQEEQQPSKSKLVGRWVGRAHSLSAQRVRDRRASVCKRKKSPVTPLKCDTDFAARTQWVSDL